jgi:hypothetical protein
MKRRFVFLLVVLSTINSYSQDTLPPIISGATAKWHHLLVEEKWVPNDNQNKDKYSWMTYNNALSNNDHLYLNYSCYNTFSGFDRNGNKLYKLNTKTGNLEWIYSYNEFQDEYKNQEEYYHTYFDKDGNIDLVGKIRLSDPLTTNNILGWFNPNPSLPAIRKIDKNTGKQIQHIYDKTDTTGQLLALRENLFYTNTSSGSGEFVSLYFGTNYNENPQGEIGFYSNALNEDLGCNDWSDKSYVYFNSDVPDVEIIEFQNNFKSLIMVQDNEFSGILFQYKANRPTRNRAKLLRMKMDDNDRLTKIREVNFEKDIVYPLGNIGYRHFTLKDGSDFIVLQYYDTTGLGLTSMGTIYNNDLDQVAYFKNLSKDNKKYVFSDLLHQEGSDLYLMSIVYEDYFGQIAYRQFVKFNISDGTITPLQKVVMDESDPRKLRSFIPHLSNDKRTLIVSSVTGSLNNDNQIKQFILGYNAKDFGLDFTSNNDDLSEVQAFTCYPNPASNQVTVSFTDETNGTLHLYNAYGQLSLQKSIGGQDCTIDTADLIGGIYQLQFIDSKGVSSKAMPLVVIK